MGVRREAYGDQQIIIGNSADLLWQRAASTADVHGSPPHTTQRVAQVSRHREGTAHADDEGRARDLQMGDGRFDIGLLPAFGQVFQRHDIGLAELTEYSADITRILQ
ncbi:hypothetical protein D3C72_1881640 [compost metagenome]